MVESREFRGSPTDTLAGVASVTCPGQEVNVTTVWSTSAMGWAINWRCLTWILGIHYIAQLGFVELTLTSSWPGLAAPNSCLGWLLQSSSHPGILHCLNDSVRLELWPQLSLLEQNKRLQWIWWSYSCLFHNRNVSSQRNWNLDRYTSVSLLRSVKTIRTRTQLFHWENGLFYNHYSWKYQHAFKMFKTYFCAERPWNGNKSCGLGKQAGKWWKWAGFTAWFIPFA